MHVTHDVDAPAGPPVTFDDFLHVDIRTATVVAAEPCMNGSEWRARETSIRRRSGSHCDTVWRILMLWALCGGCRH